MLTCAGLAACSGPRSGAATPALPPLPVTVVPAQSRDVPLLLEYVGQVAGFKDVQVRASVTGTLLHRNYVEGHLVKEGESLFQIDPSTYIAAVDDAKGAVAVDEAKVVKTLQDVNRILPLYQENAVSQKDRDDAVAAYEAAKASLVSSQARLRAAKINLDYTRVTAPISGVTSKETVSEGSLIIANTDAALLTTVSQIDPAYVNFSYTDSESQRFNQLEREGKMVMPKNLDNLTVKVKLGNGTFYAKTGKLNFTDSLVDTGTGTIRARAIFPNADRVLLPGQFVRVYVQGFTRKQTITVPQRAVVQTQKGTVLFVVGKDGKAAVRPVYVGDQINDDVVIDSGLKGGETVIVDGVGKIRPGLPVKATPYTPAAIATPDQPQ